MKQIDKPWQPDATQQKIIDCDAGCHLVLAPPGCGKTQILAERIRRAHEHGVAYEDMLCLTFTNRAARGMRERITENLGDSGTAEVFVGNVHRYCSRFLFEHQIVPAESAVIDDDTMVSILCMYLGEDELKVMNDNRRRRQYSTIMMFSHLMYEIRHGIDKSLRLHPECITAEDIAVLKAICKAEGKPFTAEMMLDIYDHNDYYVEVTERQGFDYALRQTSRETLAKMKFAHAYEAYKQQRHLLDFEDLLEMTYVALRDGNDYRRYAWIQVDEVQDLNLLQLAIIDQLSTFFINDAHSSPDSNSSGQSRTTSSLLTSNSSLLTSHSSLLTPHSSLLMYLGDEQQAIFSFMGAKQKTLDLLKARCKGNIHHLGVNHRSPRYLVNLLNTYAVHLLGADQELLPESQNSDEAAAGELQIIGSDNVETECRDVARMAVNLTRDSESDTTAIIVNSNKDADAVSQELQQLGQAHFKVSGTDLFSTDDVKLVMAHLSVLANERNFLAWSQLLKGLHIFQTNRAARQFVHQLSVRAIAPTDFFFYEDSTYVQQFVKTYDTQDIVVFDTETTGLDVFEDDVIQIAAERIRQGRSVGKFSIYIETDREIPVMLGDVENPIIEERKHQRLYPHAEALQRFLDFAGDAVLLGHNAEYDYRIMEYNLSRYLPAVNWQERYSVCYDSLKLIRLLRPDLRAYKLKLLLQELDLQGENSHLADDDVNATVSLMRYCYEKGSEMVESQREFMARTATQERVKLMRKHYAPLFMVAHARLYDRLPPTEEPAMVQEMQRFMEQLKEKGWTKGIDKMSYIYRFLDNDVIDSRAEPSLRQQLDRHIMEMTTFKEADLCGSESIDDRIFVTTIHKAKGLEFDNVIVYDVVDGVLPNFRSLTDPRQMAEEARKLYVAMSRARRRLIISYSLSRQTYYETKPQQMSRFLKPVLHLFEQK